jgi:hypothetical protein
MTSLDQITGADAVPEGRVRAIEPSSEQEPAVRRKLGQEVKRRFIEQLRMRLPQFVEIEIDPNQFGWRVFEWTLSPDLKAYVCLFLSKKMTPSPWKLRGLGKAAFRDIWDIYLLATSRGLAFAHRSRWRGSFEHDCPVSIPIGTSGGR